LSGTALQRRPTSSGKPTTEESARVGDHLLTVATALFVKDGFAATSMDQVARMAGCSKATLYRRHASKEDLFAAVLLNRGRQFLDTIAIEATGHAKPVDELRAVLRAFLDFVLDERTVETQRLLIADGGRVPGLTDIVMEEIVGPFTQRIEALLRQLIPSGPDEAPSIDVAALGHMLTGLVCGWTINQALIRNPVLQDKIERDRFFEAAWTLFSARLFDSGG
jgi:AcrR family transcriptional regulator